MANLTYMTDEDFRWEVVHTGRISLPALKITVAVLVSLALTSFVGRLSIRLSKRRRLYLDDGILVIAVGCLCGMAASFYKNSFLFFLVNAIVQSPSLKSTTAFLLHAESVRDNQKPRNTFAFLNWTTIYAVKFCFFAFFKPLLRNFYGLTIYFWISATFTVLAWIATASSGWFFSIYANRANAHPGQRYTPDISFTVSISLLDIISDIMIVSIPIILLHHARIKLITKLGIMSFLSLSLFMVICVIIRLAGFKRRNGKPPETTWRLLWQIAESCTAVTMASLTAFRVLLVPKDTNRNTGESQNSAPPWWSTGKWGSWLRISRRRTGQVSMQKTCTAREYIEMPNVPSATFTGIRSYIRRNQRDGPDTTIAESEYDPSEADYHRTLRAPTG